MEELVACRDSAVGDANLLHRIEDCRTSNAEPRAVMKNFRSSLPNRPVPSAMFKLIDRAARRSWLAISHRPGWRGRTRLVERRPRTCRHQAFGNETCLAIDHAAKSVAKIRLRRRLPLRPRMPPSWPPTSGEVYLEPISIGGLHAARPGSNRSLTRKARRFFAT
jgi:hypothetical protein